MDETAREEARRILGGKARATLDNGVEEKAAAVVLLKEVASVVQDLSSRVACKATTETEIEVTFKRGAEEGFRAGARYEADRFEVKGDGDWLHVPVEYSYGSRSWIPTDSNRSGSTTAAGVLCQRLVDVAVAIRRPTGL